VSTVWTLDILNHLSENPDRVFTSQEVSDEFKITVNESCKRLYKLKNWRMIKCTKKKKPYEYQISDKGIKYIEKMKEKGINSMTPETLEKNWDKFSSIEFLKSRGLNVPICELVTDNDTLVARLSTYKAVSIRTFKPGKIATPHLPNQKFTSGLVSKCIGLIDDGYKLILAQPIDPSNAVVKGNVKIDSNGWLMEYIKGAGTVRDIEKTYIDDDNYGSITNDVQLVSKHIGPGAVSIIREVEKMFWGKPIIVEWSIYSENIGTQNSKIIFWEVRKAEYKSNKGIVRQFHRKDK
jgi:hypothetical protein